MASTKTYYLEETKGKGKMERGKKTTVYKEGTSDLHSYFKIIPSSQ